MSCHVVVAAAPMAACAPDKTWRAAAAFLERRLHERFGPAVSVEFAELFTADLERHPEIEALVAEGVVPPIVLLDGELHSSGGKLRVSEIERAVAARLEPRPVAAGARAVVQPGRFGSQVAATVNTKGDAP